MSRILCTMPGRHGDILWALPTVRALAEKFGEPVYLALSPKYGSLRPLLERQSYIAGTATPLDWVVEETAPMTPRIPPTMHISDYFVGGAFDHVVHLGYEGWPTLPLPYDIAARAGVTIDLTRPWITAPYPMPGSPPPPIAVGFTDEHFELKYGLWWLLLNRFRYGAGKLAEGGSNSIDIVNVSNSPRWTSLEEGSQAAFSWETAAAWIAGAQVFVGCCSALHVLAVALGTPAVIVEPAAARLQEVFWPCGFDGRQVQVVRGGDGLPTVDARHLGDLVAERLAAATMGA